ncbi:MAG: hypothetical protein LBQ22_07030 [Bacteroidales bacterium]|jgi:hypothetical protein|nr:hypothetical protein [Bacteroidales bacterium]
MQTKKSLTDSMAAISKAINGVLSNSEILEVMAGYGYAEERIRNEGLAMYNETQQLILNQKKEYGEQYTASKQVNELWQEAYEVYISILRLSRIALKNKTGALHSIGATGTRKRSLTGFIDNARMLYSNLLSQPEMLHTVETFGITSEKLQNGLTQIEELETSYLMFFKEKGEAQNSTLERDKIFDALYDWYSDFRATARVALSGNPQLLEKLGIVVKR